MNRSADVAARDAKIAELKQLITTGRYETFEKLEEAVDRLMWSEQDRVQEEQNRVVLDIARSHPK